MLLCHDYGIWGRRGQGNIPSLLRDCLRAPWEVAFVTCEVQWVEEQHRNAWENLCHCDSECLNGLTRARGIEELVKGDTGHMLCILVPVWVA